jgi:hypothetical protein
MSKSNAVIPLTTTNIRSLFGVGYHVGGHTDIFAATQGHWQLAFWRIYIMTSKHTYQHYQGVAKRAFQERDHFAGIAQQMADLNFLAAEYMKRRGLQPELFKQFLGGKEAKRLMLKEANRRSKEQEK